MVSPWPMAGGILVGWLLAVFHNWLDRERHKPTPPPRRSFSVEPAKPWIIGDGGRTRPAWRVRLFEGGAEIEQAPFDDEYLEKYDAEERGQYFVAGADREYFEMQEKGWLKRFRRDHEHS